MRILLVEDDFLIRMVADEYLSDLGHEVVQAADGDEAADLLASSPGFDAIFTDVRMPGSLDGLDVASRAREDDPTVPILVASGFATNLEGRLSVIDPSAVFISKPYALEQIGTILKSIVRRSSGSS